MGSRRRLSLSLILGAAAACGLLAQDHPIKPVPEFTTGDECLFCHRTGPVPETWQMNAHARTIRPLADEAGQLEFPSGATHVLGARAPFRGLKQAGYGKFALLTPDLKTWDLDKFAARCGGCHTTAFDSTAKTFATAAIDCYSCHGVANMNHTKDKSLMWLSAKHERDPKLITSICAQCHMRGGHSKATGAPYAANFVPGGNLFDDYLPGNSDANPGDRHIYRDVQEVLDGGSVTCLNCHRIHSDGTRKHRLVLTGPICLECHNETGPKKVVKKYAVHSALCEY